MKLADYSQAVTGPQLDVALREGRFDGVFHYLAGTPGFALRIEDPAVVADIRSRGWPQAGIDIPRDPVNVDGAATAARIRDLYGFSPGLEVYLDVEPSRFALDPAGWARAADDWCDAIRRAGFVPGAYGTDDTVAACANHADAIWRAKPGMCDPAGPGLADAFFAGRRIVQCGSGVWGGVEFDVSYSQFSIAGDDFMAGPLSDPAVQQHLLDTVDGAYWLARTGYDGDPAATPPPAHYGIFKDVPAALADIRAAIAQLTPGAVDVNALAAALATHTLTAVLTDAERDELATHVLQHLAKDAAAG